MPTMQIYGSNSTTVNNYSRQGERYDKRVFIDKQLKYVLLDVALKYREDGPRDSDVLNMEARINHFDIMARVCERLVMFDIPHEIKCAYEDFTVNPKDGRPSFVKQALRMYVTLPLDYEGFPSVDEFIAGL